MANWNANLQNKKRRKEGKKDQTLLDKDNCNNNNKLIIIHCCWIKVNGSGVGIKLFAMAKTFSNPSSGI